MSKSKAVDELTIEDFRSSPIWIWDDEGAAHEGQDETWVKPANTSNFTKEYNGSIVSGVIGFQDETTFPMMANLDIDTFSATLSSVVFYREADELYVALEDVVRAVEFPVLICIKIDIHRVPTTLEFAADRKAIYMNKISAPLHK